MNGKQANGPVTYCFPKVEKLDNVTGKTKSTHTLQAAVAALAAAAAGEPMHPDEIAARLLLGESLGSTLYNWRSERADQVHGELE